MPPVVGDEEPTRPHRARHDTAKRWRRIAKEKILAPLAVAAVVGAGGFALGTTRALGTKVDRSEAAAEHAAQSETALRRHASQDAQIADNSQRIRVIENTLSAQTAILERIEQAVGAERE